MPAKEIIKAKAAVPFITLVREVALTVPAVQKELEDSGSSMYCREATVEIKLAFSAKENKDFSVKADAKVGFGLWAVGVDASYARKYEFQAQATSTLKMVFVGIEPPATK
jgi:hypothetical protein